MVPKWCLAVSRLVTRKEQQIPPYEVYFQNQRVEEVQYNKFEQNLIPIPPIPFQMKLLMSRESYKVQLIYAICGSVCLQPLSLRLENRAEISYSLWGIFCGTFDEKKSVRSSQVTKLWRHKRNNLRQDFSEIVRKRNWRGAIDLNGDS